MRPLSQREMDDLISMFQEIAVGSSIRTNHESDYCSGDSNSMIVRRDDDGFNVKCFRCGRFGKRGLHGVSALKSKMERAAGKRDSGAYTADSRVARVFSEVLDGCVQGTGSYSEHLRDFGIHGRVWLNRYGITADEVLKYGITYDHKHDAVLLPVFDAEGCAGFQVRHLHPEYVGPKYLSYFVRQPGAVFCAGPGASMERLVITEDVISAIKVGRVVLATPLRTTQMNDRQLADILDTGVDQFQIWLDDDNTQVKQHQIALKRKLEKLGTCEVIKTANDPKCYSESEIISIVYSTP